MKPVRSRVGPTRKPPIWEKSKKEKRTNRVVRMVLILIGLIVLVNLLIRLPAIYREVSHPFERYPGDKEKLAGLETSFRTNLLLISYKKDGTLVDLAIVTYEPVDKRLAVLFFDLPENAQLRRTAGGVFGKEGVLGLQRFVSNQIAVPLDRYLAFEGSDLAFTSENATAGYKEIKSVSFIFKALSIKHSLDRSLATNLTSPEIISLIWKVRSAEFEEKDNFFLKDAGSQDLQSKSVADFIGDLFIDRRLADEAASVTIRNFSGVAGLGTTLASYLNNLGVTVVGVESGDKPVGKSLLVEKNSKPQFESRLVSIIPFDKEKVGKEDFSGDYLIIVGEDATKKLTLP